MKKAAVAIVLLFTLTFFAAAQAPAKGLKVFISVDMEGITGVVNWDDVTVGGLDYGLFRKLMTQEVNAAVEAAQAAGAAEIVVRDAHDTGRNILPDLLNPGAKLLRDWSYGPLSMMEGIDKTFDAVIFIGYHARASTPNGVLKHTMTTKLLDVIINGLKMPEAGVNALIAGMFDVPVVLVTGDKAICGQARDLFGDVETVMVKEGIGSAELGLSPQAAQAQIREKTIAALRRVKAFKPYKLAPPYTLDVAFADEAGAQKASWIPGAVRKDEHTVSFKADDVMTLIKLFRLAKM
ncbi:MAG: M55 family metallopeptidase [Acidobacteriota bacterium]|nr:M55 family metallopeptidase [Acidobacteriota bacterium]